MRLVSVRIWILQAIHAGDKVGLDPRLQPTVHVYCAIIGAIFLHVARGWPAMLRVLGLGPWRGLGTLKLLLRGAEHWMYRELTTAPSQLPPLDTALQGGACGQTAFCPVQRKSQHKDLDPAQVASLVWRMADSWHCWTQYKVDPHPLPANYTDTTPELPPDTWPPHSSNHSSLPNWSIIPTSSGQGEQSLSQHTGEMECSSVIKKRRKKMNRHKYKKRRKKLKFLRRRLGK